MPEPIRVIRGRLPLFVFIRAWRAVALAEAGSPLFRNPP